MTKNALPKDYQQYFKDSISFFYEFENIREFTSSNYDTYLKCLTKDLNDIIDDKIYEYVFYLLKKLEYQLIPQIPKDGTTRKARNYITMQKYVSIIVFLMKLSLVKKLIIYLKEVNKYRQKK